MSTRVITARSASEIADAAREGAAAIEGGSLVGFATETVYGIAALATNGDTMARLRELKNRPQRPFSVHLGNPDDAFRFAREFTDDARRLIRKAMPGPVTLLVPTHGQLGDAELAAIPREQLYDRLVDADVIGLRCPDEPLAAAMLSAVRMPVVAPSANLAGERSPRTAQDVLASMDGKIDLLIDSGPTRYGKDSTIVDLSGDSWRIVREGVYDERTLRRLMTRMYLFVCTGNTCRSPLAAGIAKSLLARKLGVAVQDLPDRNIEVLSAGVMAAQGQHASPEAVEAAADYGADLGSHRSRRVSLELIHAADMVFCMTEFHVAQVRQMAPQASSKVVRLDEAGDIPDPIGGGLGVYRQTAKRIESALQARFEKGLP